MTWEDIMKDNKMFLNRPLRDKYEKKMDLDKPIQYLNDNIFEAYQQFNEDLPDEILNEKELIALFKELVLERINTLGVQ